MEINIRLTSETTPTQLLAVAALVDVLAGRVAPMIATAVMPELVVPNAPTTSTPTTGAGSPLMSTAPTPDAGAPDRDTAGILWDERIHSASKATVADGTWRRRKNTPDATYDAVMAELRAGHTGAVADHVGDPILSPSTDDTPPPPVEPAVTETAADVADNASDEDDTPPPPPTSDGPDLTTWPKFVQAVQSKPDVPETAKTYDKLNELSATFGAGKFLEMKDKPGQWAMFYDMVG